MGPLHCLHALNLRTCFLSWIRAMQHNLTPAGDDLDYLDHDLSDLSETHQPLHQPLLIREGVYHSVPKYKDLLC